MSILILSFSCTGKSCRSLVHESGNCQTCQVEVDIDKSKADLETLKQEVALVTSEEYTDREKYYQDIRDIWIR